MGGLQVSQPILRSDGSTIQPSILEGFVSLCPIALLFPPISCRPYYRSLWRTSLLVRRSPAVK